MRTASPRNSHTRPRTSTSARSPRRKPQIYGIYWSTPPGPGAAVGVAHPRARVPQSPVDRESEGRRHFDPGQVPVYAESHSTPSARLVVARPLAPRRRRIRSSVGSIRASGRCIATSFPATGADTIRSMLPGGRTCRRSRHPPSARCSGPFRVGPRYTRQGKGDGTLQLIPIVTGMVYLLLRALQDDVPEDDLCGARRDERCRSSRDGMRCCSTHSPRSR
jgi:hypothetical protein